MRALIGVVALVSVPVLTIAILRTARRYKPQTDPCCWQREPAEPWGSIILILFFLFPVMRALADWIGWAPFFPLAMASTACWAVWRMGAITGVRRLTIGETEIEIWSGFRREVVPMGDILSVTSILDEAMQPEVHLADGRWITLPGDAHGRELATQVASRVGQRWGVPR